MALLERVREKLESTITPARLQDLAFEFGVAPHHLQRLFRKAYGASPRQYQERQRLARAMALLRAGEPAGEVALSLEYAEASSFTRAFRREFGAPPTAFRKN